MFVQLIPLHFKTGPYTCRRFLVDASILGLQHPCTVRDHRHVRTAQAKPERHRQYRMRP